VGVLLDIDHLFEYFTHTGMNINIKRFFHYSYQIKYKRLYLFFHAYEYLIFIALITIIAGYHPLLIAIGIGMMQHLLLDQIYNQARPMAYFISYRIKNGFSAQSFFKDGVLSRLPNDEALF